MNIENIIKEPEIWSSIKGYSNYQISTYGNVRNTSTGGRLKNSKTTNGYLKVTLCKSVPKTFQVHRLVAETFLPNPENLPVVNHIDEDKTNPYYKNLEWCSHSYNQKYSNKHKDARVYTFRFLTGTVVETKDLKGFAEDNNLSIHSVRAMVAGRCKKHRCWTFIK